jgi:hypothetical protein
MIPKKPAPDLIRGGCRFPACAKHRQRLSVSFDASAGEARSEKIMRDNKLKRNDDSTPFRFSMMIAAKRRGGQPPVDSQSWP